MIGFFARFFGSGVVSGLLDLADQKIKTDTNRDKIKGDIIKAHYASRGDWMRAGGFWLMLLFAAPLALWFGSVVVYSVFWCADCMYPQTWSVAALPAPLDDWAGLMVMSIFGVIGLDRFRR